jgi:type IX secretion system PorP/SprF family membrane protein
MLNRYYENPAYGGLERSLSVYTSYRDQYNALAGNPKTFYIGADMPFYLWNGALGVTLYNQRSGVLSNTNLRFSYNYVMGLPFGFLSFGARLGVNLVNLDGNRIVTPDGTYEGIFTHNDPLLENNVINGVGPSWEIGSYFMGSNLQAGITISEFPSHSYSLGNGSFKSAVSGSVFAMYKYEYSDEIDITPSILLRADPAVFQSDIGVIATINNNLMTGLNFRGYNARSVDALSVIIGTNLGDKYKLYYSFDFGLSALRTVNQGTHEVMLSYNLQKLIGIGLPPKIIYNPRDL